MGTSELNKRQPILSFLAPADTQAAPFSEPTQSAFHNPTSGWETCLTGNGTVINDRFTTSSAMLDMGDVTCLFDEFMDVWIIVPLVCA